MPPAVARRPLTWNGRRGRARVVPAPRVEELESRLVPSTLEFNGDVARKIFTFGPDLRVPVGRPTEFPFSAVGRLAVQFPDGHWIYGTGALVSPRHVLTAGHMVYAWPDEESSFHGWAAAAYFSPGQSGRLLADDLLPGRSDDQPFGSAFVTQYRGSAGWAEGHDYDYDYALLTLDRDVGTFTGWLDFGAAADADLLGLTVSTAGYPADRNGPGRADPYLNSGPITEVTDHQLHSDEIDAAGGQSGSPVWALRDGRRVVHGIVSHGTTAYNAFTRIDAGLAALLQQWIAGDGPTTNLPDLLAYDDWFRTATEVQGADVLRPGDEFTVRAAVRNNGTAAAGGFAVSFYATGNGYDYPLGTATVPALAPFARGDVEVHGAFPDSIPPGTYTVRYWIDLEGAQAELNEGNNVGVFPGALTVVLTIDGSDPPPEAAVADATPGELFAARAYRDLLGRAADAAGLAFWGGALDRGAVSRDLVAAVLTATAEYRTRVVQSAYRTLLGRDADAGGLEFFVSALGAGGTEAQVRAALVGSREYYDRAGGTADGFLTAVAHDVLGQSSAAELAPWAESLAGGASPAAVAAAAVAGRTARVRAVQGLYADYLDRPADAGGLEFFVNALGQGLGESTLVAALVASSEYAAR